MSPLLSFLSFHFISAAALALYPLVVPHLSPLLHSSPSSPLSFLFFLRPVRSVQWTRIPQVLMQGGRAGAGSGWAPSA